MTWLQGTLYGAVQQSVHNQYLAVLNIVALAGVDTRVPVPPENVMIAWRRELARLRTTRLQGELSFLDAATRAGWTEAAISRALAIPHNRSVAEHRADLESERDHYHPSRHPHPWTG